MIFSACIKIAFLNLPLRTFQVQELLESAEAKLIEYHFTVVGYDSNPLDVDNWPTSAAVDDPSPADHEDDGGRGGLDGDQGSSTGEPQSTTSAWGPSTAPGKPMDEEEEELRTTPIPLLKLRRRPYKTDRFSIL